MVAAAAVPAGAKFLSTWGPSILGGAASLFGGHQGNVASAREAQRNRDFQLMMSNTAHQREVSDLRKAGLNPILSVNKGASTAGGSMAPQHDIATPAVNSAMSARRLTAELDLLSKQAYKTQEEGRNASNIADISSPAAAAARVAMIAAQNAKTAAKPVADAFSDLPEHWDRLKGGVRDAGRGARDLIINKPQEAYQWLLEQWKNRGGAEPSPHSGKDTKEKVDKEKADEEAFDKAWDEFLDRQHPNDKRFKRKRQKLDNL